MRLWAKSHWLLWQVLVGAATGAAVAVVPHATLVVPSFISGRIVPVRMDLILAFLPALVGILGLDSGKTPQSQVSTRAWQLVSLEVLGAALPTAAFISSATLFGHTDAATLRNAVVAWSLSMLAFACVMRYTAFLVPFTVLFISLTFGFDDPHAPPAAWAVLASTGTGSFDFVHGCLVALAIASVPAFLLRRGIQIHRGHA